MNGSVIVQAMAYITLSSSIISKDIIERTNIAMSISDRNTSTVLTIRYKNNSTIRPRIAIGCNRRQAIKRAGRSINLPRRIIRRGKYLPLRANVGPYAGVRSGVIRACFSREMSRTRRKNPCRACDLPRISPCSRVRAYRCWRQLSLSVRRGHRKRR